MGALSDDPGIKIKIATLPVREYAEKMPVELWLRDGRIVVRAYNEDGHNLTDVDLGDLLDWARPYPMESPNGGHGTVATLSVAE
jgi:hypothetical protein